MAWRKAVLTAVALVVVSAAIGLSAGLLRRTRRRSSPEADCALEFLRALEAGEMKRLEELVAVRRVSRRGEEYLPFFDPAAFGGSRRARSLYLRNWADRSLDALHRAGVRKPSAARVVDSIETKEPKGTEILLEYEAISGRLRLGAVVADFTPARLAFIAPEGWRGARARSGVVKTVVRAPVNVYVVDPGLIELVGGRIPPGRYAGVEMARGLSEDVAGEFVAVGARGVFVAGEPVGKESFADAVARVRGGAKMMVVFADCTVGWGLYEEVLQGLSRAGLEEAAFVVRTTRPPSALRRGRDCFGIVRCVPGARLEDPELFLVPVVSGGYWIAVDGDGTAKTPGGALGGVKLRALLESAARGSGVRLHLPPELRFAQILGVLQFFGEEPSKVELSGPIRLKQPEPSPEERGEEENP